MVEKTIQTEVDSLVSLVNEVGQISIKNAAKRLGVPVGTVTEWAAFLEQEGVVNIEYKFTTPFLVKKQLTKEQAFEKQKAISEEKDVFQRKSQSTLTYLNKLEQEINSFKAIFDSAGKHLSSEMADFNKVFDYLKKAQKERQELEDQAARSKQETAKKIAEINEQIAAEQSKFTKLYDIINAQSQSVSKIIEIQKDQLDAIKSTDLLLDKRLTSIKKQIDSKKRSARESNVKNVYSAMSRMEKQHNGMRDFLDSKKTILNQIVDNHKKQEEYIDSLNRDVLAKIDAINDRINKIVSDVESIPTKINTVMNQKASIMKTLDILSQNEKELKEKLQAIIKKSAELKSKKHEDISDEMKELEDSLNGISEKKSFFEKEIKKLFDMFK